MSETSQEQPVGNPIHSPDSSAKRLFWWGVAITGAYLGILAFYTWHEWVQMLAMKPDGLATFLSGAFAPLAFLWLVLGFRQQGDELQNSARALWLQGEELRNSVEQQRQLVQVSREQLEAEREQRVRDLIAAEHAAQPKFILTLRGANHHGGQQATFNFALSAAGATCSNVKIFRDGNIWLNIPILVQNNEQSLHFLAQSIFDLSPMDVVIAYTDQNGGRRQVKFFVPVANSGGDDRAKSFGEPELVEGPTVRE